VLVSCAALGPACTRECVSSLATSTEPRAPIAPFTEMRGPCLPQWTITLDLGAVFGGTNPPAAAAAATESLLVPVKNNEHPPIMQRCNNVTTPEDVHVYLVDTSTWQKLCVPTHAHRRALMLADDEKSQGTTTLMHSPTPRRCMPAAASTIRKPKQHRGSLPCRRQGLARQPTTHSAQAAVVTS
jgi:hypothetical protein